MPDLLRVPLTVADYATRPARFVLGKLLELRRSDDDQAAPVTPPPASTEAAAPPQTAPKPKPRARTAAPSPKAARRATRHEPTRGQAAEIRQQEREKEWGVDNSVGANVVIDDEVKKLGETLTQS